MPQQQQQPQPQPQQQQQQQAKDLPALARASLSTLDTLTPGELLHHYMSTSPRSPQSIAFKQDPYHTIDAKLIVLEATPLTEGGELMNNGENCERGDPKAALEPRMSAATSDEINRSDGRRKRSGNSDSDGGGGGGGGGGGAVVVKVDLLTGRTHQIRAQLGLVGWPLVGDPMYGGE